MISLNEGSTVELREPIGPFEEGIIINQNVIIGALNFLVDIYLDQALWIN